MRVRRLIVTALLASTAVVMSAGVAHAAPDPKADKFTKECLKTLNDGGTLDDQSDWYLVSIPPGS